MKTVFFGPFLGEFGWEMFHWHGWVRKMCKERYGDYRKIVSTYKGREPFYPEADEFFFHPKEITNLNISQRNYIADYWYGNLPKGDGAADNNISYYADKLLSEYKKKLPKETIFFVPYKLNSYKLNGKNRIFGVLWLKGLIIYQNPKVLSIEGSEEQIFEPLKPTKEAEDFLGNTNKLICVFPRYRLSRRPDKNWSKEKYDELIERLKGKYPKHTITICGTPNGSYYTDKVPQGCIDLINVPDDLRFNVQVAALNRADMALGSESGGVHASMLTGKPTLEWGFGVNQKFVKAVNFLKAPLIFLPDNNPSVDEIEELVDLMMRGRTVERLASSTEGKRPGLKLVFREIIAMPFLKYLEKRDLKEGIINNILLK